MANIKAPKNGYAYVYLSNQSNNDVYFDNFQVGVTTGNIIEENHYYTYGLRIATLSSKKLGDSYEGSLKNNYLYQGAYSELDDDIGWNDFELRNYDPQIGRWVQQDPFEEYASPYVGMGTDPVNLVDPSGGFVLAGLTKAGTAAILMLGGAIIGEAAALISGDDDFTGALIGAGVGLGAGLANLSFRIAVHLCIDVANKTNAILNTPTKTEQTGDLPSKNNVSVQSKPPFDPESINKYIINILETVVKLKTFREAWENGSKESWEWGFDISEDENNYYGENLHRGSERDKTEQIHEPGANRSLIGDDHLHYPGLRNSPSPEDIDDLRDVLKINPKFGVFVILQTEEAYYALVVINVEEAKKFFYNNDLTAIARAIIKPTKTKKDTTKRRIRKIKKVLKRNGIRMFKTIDQDKTKFKRI